MDMSAYSAGFSMSAFSRYAAPMCRELSGKTFAVMRHMEYKERMFPTVTFADGTVTLDGAPHPYYAAKIADDAVFAAFRAGTEIYAHVYEPSQPLTPEQAAKEVRTFGGFGDAGRPLSCGLYLDLTKPSSLAMSGNGQNAPEDFRGNAVEWTLAVGVTARIDYGAGTVTFTAPGMPPYTTGFARAAGTAEIADGVYLQALFPNAPGGLTVALAMNFRSVTFVGAVFGSSPGGPLTIPIGGYGKVLNEGEIGS